MHLKHYLPGLTSIDKFSKRLMRRKKQVEDNNSSSSFSETDEPQIISNRRTTEPEPSNEHVPFTEPQPSNKHEPFTEPEPSNEPNPSNTLSARTRILIKGKQQVIQAEPPKAKRGRPPKIPRALVLETVVQIVQMVQRTNSQQK